jgi:carbon storage regulator
MLVLGRKRGETVRIGTDITVAVLEVSGGRVRLGFAAPAQVGIVRLPVRPIPEEDLDVPEGTELPARRPPEAGAIRPAGT